MTDLEDAREQAVDERARHAAAGLHRAAAARPLPPMIHSSSAGSPSRVGSRRRLLAVAAAIVVIAGIAGLYATVGRRSDPLARTSDGDPIWVIGGLPKEWRIVQVNPVPLGTPIVALYGTAAAPLGPLMQITSFPVNWHFSPLGDGDTNFVESAASGRTIVLADARDGHRIGWAHLGDVWLKIDLRPATESDLEAVAAAVTLDDAGRPVLPTAAIPNGMVEFAAGNVADAAPVALGSDFGVGNAGLTAYEGPDPNESARLASGPSSSAEFVSAALLGPLGSTTINGSPAWVVTHNLPAPLVGTTVVWERDGTLFALTTMTAGPAIDPLALSRSVRAARRGEIEQRSKSPAPVVTALEGTTAAPGPPRRAPREPSDAAPVTVEIAHVDKSANTVELSGAGSDTDRFTIDVTVVADRVQIASADSVGTLGLPLSGAAQLQQMTSGPDGPHHLVGAVAVTQDPRAASVEVLTSDGIRHRAALTATKAHLDVRFGALLVPENDFVSSSLLDPDGTPIVSTTFDR